MAAPWQHEDDLPKAIAMLALTSKETYPSRLLQQVIEYCFEQLEHRMSSEELLKFADTLREPYAAEDA